MSKRNPHIVPRSDVGGWAVQREGAERASSLHDTQAEAIAEGRRMAQNERSELFIHGRDGFEDQSTSYTDAVRGSNGIRAGRLETGDCQRPGGGRTAEEGSTGEERKVLARSAVVHHHG